MRLYVEVFLLSFFLILSHIRVFKSEIPFPIEEFSVQLIDMADESIKTVTTQSPFSSTISISSFDLRNPLFYCSNFFSCLMHKNVGFRWNSRSYDRNYKEIKAGSLKKILIFSYCCYFYLWRLLFIFYLILIEFRWIIELCFGDYYGYLLFLWG